MAHNSFYEVSEILHGEYKGIEFRIIKKRALSSLEIEKSLCFIIPEKKLARSEYASFFEIAERDNDPDAGFEVLDEVLPFSCITGFQVMLQAEEHEVDLQKYYYLYYDCKDSEWGNSIKYVGKHYGLPKDCSEKTLFELAKHFIDALYEGDEEEVILRKEDMEEYMIALIETLKDKWIVSFVAENGSIIKEIVVDNVQIRNDIGKVKQLKKEDLQKELEEGYKMEGSI